MNKKVGKFFPFVVLLLGIAASAMCFLVALKHVDSSATYTGFQVITGVKLVNIGTFLNASLPFSILALIAFLLPLVAGLLVVISPRSFIISISMFIVAAILIFMLPQYVNHFNVSLGDSVSQVSVKFGLEIGAILAGIFSIFGGIVSMIGFTKK